MRCVPHERAPFPRPEQLRKLAVARMIFRIVDASMSE